jgi:hypothetical protein
VVQTGGADVRQSVDVEALAAPVHRRGQERTERGRARAAEQQPELAGVLRIDAARLEGAVQTEQAIVLGHAHARLCDGRRG